MKNVLQSRPVTLTRCGPNQGLPPWFVPAARDRNQRTKSPHQARAHNSKKVVRLHGFMSDFRINHNPASKCYFVCASLGFSSPEILETRVMNGRT